MILLIGQVCSISLGFNHRPLYPHQSQFLFYLSLRQELLILSLLHSSEYQVVCMIPAYPRSALLNDLGVFDKV